VVATARRAGQIAAELPDAGDSLKADIDTWRAVSLSTDHD